MLSRLASVFANITAAVGTIAVDTTAAAAATAPLLLLLGVRTTEYEPSMIRNLRSWM